MRLELRLDAKRRPELDESEPAFPLVRVAEDRGFEPLRAINPTRFPTLGWAVPGCSQSFAERESDIGEQPWTGPDGNN